MYRKLRDLAELRKVVCVHNLGPQGEGGMEGAPVTRTKGLNDAEFHL